MFLRLAAVKEAGRAAAAAVPPFALMLGDLGVFPPRGAPEVVWFGLERGVPEYVRLEEYLYRALHDRGFDVDGRWSKPHITIARVKYAVGAKSIERALAKNIPDKVDKGGVISVSDVVLCDSLLRPEGPIHTVLESFPLSAVEHQLDPFPWPRL
jgi:RNA 2',3'-cyclic 3'-phosphodiesterase